jgi:predicted AlkP superfamily phosphohydrolase/phosphomutase
VTDRLLIVGWDGADWEIVDDLARRGVLPNVSALLTGGGRGTLRSTIPAHSWSAWPSFLTGVHPSGHGIYDFASRDPRDPQRRVPITSSSIRATTFLQHLSTAGRSVRAANIPVTYPPIEVSGRFISGPIVPPGGRYVHPPAWQAELDRRAPFPLNGLEWQRFSSDPAALVAEAADVVRRRGESFRVLLEGDWDVAVCVFVAPDRVQHPLGRFLLPSHPAFSSLQTSDVAEALRGFFGALDAELGRLADAAGPGATVVLMSDHGFRPVTRAIDMSALLARLGYTARTPGAAVDRVIARSRLKRAIGRTRIARTLKPFVPRPKTLRWDRTVAYASSSGGGVLLNRRGREPHGVVADERYASLREEIREALLSLRDPETGGRVIGDVHRREDLPPGPHADRAPDLLAVPAPLYSFEHTGSPIVDTSWPSASHRIDGIIAATGPGIGGDLGTRNITDLAPTALAFAGVEPPACDGIVIDEIAGRRARSGVAVASDPVRHEEQGSREDEDFMAQHLRDLGYIE